jgi:peptidoglycan/xylan/chitin deacetylase (PgdA/CDA1 family)
VTFDDGYEDNYAVAFPLLRRYKFVATFFVVTSTVGTPGHLTVAQIQEMARSGMAIESHGVHHLDFSRLSLASARTELQRSRQTIEAWAGRPVIFFAYPSGRSTPALERLLSELGYRGAVTEIPGFVRPGSAPYALERVRVDHDDSLATFARAVGIRTP